MSTAWPDALTLYAEFGIFSRKPYPKSYYFDVAGMFYQSSISQYASEILNSRYSSEEIFRLNRLRNETIFPSCQNSVIGTLPLKLKAEQFQCNLLLPLQFSGYFGFDCCAPYVDQFDYLTNVFDTIPSNIGIFVTEHDGWPKVITHHNIHYLEDKYPNLLWSPEFSNITAVSQVLMPLVDGVITVSSSMGLQSMLWDKPVFSPWQSHLKGFSFVDSLGEISIDNIRSYQTGYYDAAILTLLSRYYLIEDITYDARKFIAFITHLYHNRQAQSFIELYPQTDSIMTIIDSVESKFTCNSLL